MDIRERLQAFIAYKGLTNKSFEEICGLGNGFVSKAGFSIRREKLSLISNAFPELNLDWVINEKGEMLKPDSGIHNNKVSNNSGTVTMNNGQHISISLPEEGTQKIISPDGSVQIIPNHSKNNEYLELLREKDKQIERLLSIIENKSK